VSRFAETPEVPPAGDDDRFDVIFEMKIEAKNSVTGEEFYHADYHACTFRQPRIGLVEINQTASNLINAQVDIGRRAAFAKNPALKEFFRQEQAGE
jgi:hypothetical protein